MKEKFNYFIRHEKRYFFSAFFIPIIVMAISYLSIDIYPGSARSVLASDAFSQFSNFHASFNNMLHGKQSLFYTWNASLGLNFYALISYYLGGVFTPLVFFFKNSQIPDALYFLTLIKIGCAGVSFWIYAKNTFNINKWTHVSLAVSYSLMSFITAHSELIMWLDTFVWLPLVILGINKVMDERKPTLLFCSYLLLFISNFYFGFMVGVFSFLYFWARTSTQWKTFKKAIVPYLTTSLLAGCASMIMILPTVLDLSSNGEKLTEITKLKTTATAFWDIIIKNMVGSYDTTKYGSIPFIYIGLLSFVFCVFYFVSKKIPWKNKIAYGSIFLLIIASFYLVPLNLFWHGMHAPNMFLFRYSFVFSFLVIMLAGYGLEKFVKDDSPIFTGTVLVIIAVYIVAYAVKPKGSYTFINDKTFMITILFLLLYLVGIIFYQFYQPTNENKKIQPLHLAILLLILVSLEAFVNTNSMLNGILGEWRYASRSLYEEPYQNYKDTIDTVKKEDNDSFYRIETLDPVSGNDPFNYGYSGIGMFSSIRNRNTSSVMNELGFRSRGTNLNIRYPNNTLMMDSIMGIKYNHAKQDPMKFGFERYYENKTYQMYQNKYAMSLGTMTDEKIYQTKFPDNDNLSSQEALINQLGETNLSFYSFTDPRLVASDNATIRNTQSNITITEKKANIEKEITWEVLVPAGKQAYFSLYPTNFGDLKSSTAELTVNGRSNKTQIDITGQYYNLGYYPKETIVHFTVSFYGTSSVTFMKPPVILLDIANYKKAFAQILDKEVPFETKGRKASGYVYSPTDKQVLFTTIPYDKGWKAYVDGKRVAIKPFKKAFITIPLDKGKHNIKFVFLPQGFTIGVLCFIVGIGGFILYSKLILPPTSRHSTHSKKKRHKEI